MCCYKVCRINVAVCLIIHPHPSCLPACLPACTILSRACFACLVGCESRLVVGYSNACRRTCSLRFARVDGYWPSSSVLLDRSMVRNVDGRYSSLRSRDQAHHRRAKGRRGSCQSCTGSCESRPSRTTQGWLVLVKQVPNCCLSRSLARSLFLYPANTRTTQTPHCAYVLAQSTISHTFLVFAHAYDSCMLCTNWSWSRYSIVE
jgi:hypothetical protein